jgi:TonB family protein
MREKNVIVIALFCSLIWHLLGAQAVSVVWPVRLVPSEYVAVNFLGSLIENMPLASEQTNIAQPQPPAAAAVAGEQAEMLLRATLPLSELSEKSVPSPLSSVAGTEQVQVIEAIDAALKRAVVSKPALPVYPEWAKEFGGDFEVELKFLILSDGTVGTVERITSSGYPELDEIGSRYVRRWRFMPLPAGASEEKQWGIIKLVFKLQ